MFYHRIMPVLCLYFPHLQADLALAAHPRLADMPLVMVDRAGPEGRVIARSPRAALLGVLPGQTALAARARAPKAAFLADNHLRAAAFLARTAEVLSAEGMVGAEAGEDFVLVHLGRHADTDRVVARASGLNERVTIRVGLGRTACEAMAAARSPRMVVARAS
jgi:hypothetical protein